MPEINISVVMGQIIMTVKAIDWTEGNVGHVGVCLNGGSCRIDWAMGAPVFVVQACTRNSQSGLVECTFIPIVAKLLKSDLI